MKIGDYVFAKYKSGIYVGELLQFEQPKAKVRMLAVHKHPTQGDLHHPMQLDVEMFHQRRALSYREVANVHVNDISPYLETKIPDYEQSLRTALQLEIETMEQLGTPFAHKCLELLEQLKTEYWTSNHKI